MPRKISALIIGNADYQGDAKLNNATNDAHDIADAFIKLGYVVKLRTNVTTAQFHEAITEHATSNCNVSIFYYAGHGFQFREENYLAGIDTQFTDEKAAKYTSMPLKDIIDAIEEINPSVSVYIIDACRNNPFGSRGGTNGLAQTYAPKGTLIAYSTSPGERASDGNGRNSEYTKSLLSHIFDPDIAIEETFKRIRKTLSQLTAGCQTSWEHTSLIGDFVFKSTVISIDTEFSESAKRDRYYTCNLSQDHEKIINALKSHNYYSQNEGISLINADILGTSDSDYHFVLGRNIYQAAEGGANSAKDFINRFQEICTSFDQKGTNNLLKGMLFEVFFDKNGEFRDSGKQNNYQALLKLRMHKNLLPAFDWLHVILDEFSSKFIIIPYAAMGMQTFSIDFDSEDKRKISEIKWNEKHHFKLNSENPNTFVRFSPSNLNIEISKLTYIPVDRINIEFITQPPSFEQLYLHGEFRVTPFE